jgi:hypothetical protein
MSHIYLQIYLQECKIASANQNFLQGTRHFLKKYVFNQVVRNFYENLTFITAITKFALTHFFIKAYFNAVLTPCKHLPIWPCMFINQIYLHF